ncbi:MAG: hypothetical protein JO357_00745 [Hyphomicrobiales bacterium]|nr:hypothetical protein [Acidobacteriaceae bacterium]MBV9135559.1 hypothetical protein [Hyphomicrobiales bacterium]
MRTYTYTTLSDPSAAPGGSTYPASINDRGQVTGYYTNGTTDVGFLYSNGTWTTLSDPSAGTRETIPRSINDGGQVTGDYFSGTAYLGFLYSNGAWTTLSDPSAASGTSTYPESINDRGQVTGYYDNGTANVGFLYSNGAWTNLIDPLAGSGGYTVANSINDSGQVTGYYSDGTNQAAFIYSNGTWTNLSDPSAGADGVTGAISINNSGQIIGNFKPTPGTTFGITQGFLYSNGTWTTLSDPSAASGGYTVATSINNSGQVTGYYWNGTADVGFLYGNGTWTNLTPPSLSSGGNTLTASINDRGQVTGDYYNGTANVGFIVNPTDVNHKREAPTLTIKDHSLSLPAGGGTALLPISVSAYDFDDTVSVKISGVPGYDTLTAGDGDVVAKKGDSYTFTAADLQSGLTLHSSFERKYHPDHDYREHDRDERKHSEQGSASTQSKLTVTAFNTTQGENAVTSPQTITVTSADRLTGLLHQYVAAGFNDDHAGVGQIASTSQIQSDLHDHLAISSPHHRGWTI